VRGYRPLVQGRSAAAACAARGSRGVSRVQRAL
jgi:hypothetical protein